MRTATDGIVDTTLEPGERPDPDAFEPDAFEPDASPDPDVLRRAVRAIAAASGSAAECRLFLEQLGIPVAAIRSAQRSPQLVS